MLMQATASGPAVIVHALRKASTEHAGEQNFPPVSLLLKQRIHHLDRGLVCPFSTFRHDMHR